MPEERATQPPSAESKPLTSLTLAEALKRYEVGDAPVDLAAVRKDWQEEAARALIERLDDCD